jgi:hypothetical protein
VGEGREGGGGGPAGSRNGSREYIIQLADEPPSHIIAPAIHKTRGQVAELFTAELGMPPTDDVAKLTNTARITCAIVLRRLTSASAA